MDFDLDALRLRPMVKADYPAFIERSMREYAEEIAANADIPLEAARTKSVQTFEELLPDGLESADQHLFVIVDGLGERVGELWLGIREPLGVREAFGYDFWVLPELRDQGIGRRAMQLGAQAARELGATRLALNVFGDNERATHLYRSFGFRVTNVNMAMSLDE
jgi:ribosomal protein S18 acetylase RimI-like enzyme